jgi:peptidoglycan/LPS O-acetylase OafA/YrhL
MYLISPFYIKWLFNNPNRAALSVGVISLCSIIITFISLCIIFKEGYDPKVAEGDYFWGVYVMPWCRISPYLFGMLAALEHRNDKERKIFANSSVIVEWIAFIVFVFISCNPFLGKVEMAKRVWSSFYRPLYGMCLAHLIKLMISPNPEDPIPWYRPTRYLRSLLSWHLWVPIGNLSYSIYLWHLVPLTSLTNGDFGINLRAPALV